MVTWPTACDQCLMSARPVLHNDGQKRSLTGKKLHSWVFGSYFSTTSMGDCWLPKPPITSRTSFAPAAKGRPKPRQPLCSRFVTAPRPCVAHTAPAAPGTPHRSPRRALVLGPCIWLRSSGRRWNFFASSTRSLHCRLHRMNGCRKTVVTDSCGLC